MIRIGHRDQCEKCGSYDTYSWRGQGTLDMTSYFECYDCGLTMSDGEIILEGKGVKSENIGKHCDHRHGDPAGS